MEPVTDPLQQARQHFADGLVQIQSGHLEAAEVSFAAALALAPGRPSVLTNLGATRVQLGRCAEALAPLQQATLAESDNAEAWGYLGMALLHTGAHAQALDAIDRALALTPQRAPLWLQRGLCLVPLERHAEALAAFERACQLDATLADAWSHRGTLLREVGRLADAAHCFEQAIAHGADAEVHRYFLASVSGDAALAARAQPNAPADYVRQLFDGYASDFQQHLLGPLRYQGHSRLVQQLRALGSGPWRHAVDLGCGTGLCGALLRPLAGRITGIDLSAAMLEQARGTGAYQALLQTDLADGLRHCALQASRGEQPPVDLVLAADVFIYVGDLAAVFDAVARLLPAGGVFAFTLERSARADGFELRPSLRYAHSEGYARELAARFGLTVSRVERDALRQEQQTVIEGLYVCLIRTDAPYDGKSREAVASASGLVRPGSHFSSLRS